MCSRHTRRRGRKNCDEPERSTRTLWTICIARSKRRACDVRDEKQSRRTRGRDGWKGDVMERRWRGDEVYG